MIDSHSVIVVVTVTVSVKVPSLKVTQTLKSNNDNWADFRYNGMEKKTKLFFPELLNVEYLSTFLPLLLMLLFLFVFLLIT